MHPEITLSMPPHEPQATTRTATAPAAGDPVVVVSVDGDQISVGELSVWSAGDLVTTARVRLDADTAAQLIGFPVFARINSSGTLVVLKAHARPVAGTSSEIELMGIQALALESRRTSLRAQLVRDIVLRSDADEPIATRTVDLSAGGCLVDLPSGTAARIGDRFSVVLTDSHGRTLELSSEVIRVDPSTRQAALRFVNISSHDSERIEREVMDWLASQQ